MRWERHVARMAEIRNAYNILVGKPEGKRPLGRPRRRCEYNIRKDHSSHQSLMIGRNSSQNIAYFFRIEAAEHVAQIGTSGGLLWAR
jgi:hypothetical protein